MINEADLIDPRKIRRILIRAVNWLGDAVMTTPAIYAIRNSFPAARITLLAAPLVAELFSANPLVDEVMVYEKRGRHAGLAGRLRLSRELKEKRFDLAILLQNAFDAALLAWLAGIPHRIGYRTDCRGFLLSNGCPVSGESRRLHHTEYYLKMLSHYGITARSKTLSLTVTEEEELEAEKTLMRGGIAATDFLLGINPGATYGSAKRWYPERFAAVADELSGIWGARVVITGAPAEKEIADDIAAAMKVECLNMAGRTSVRQLMALIKRCNFFITNDSGPMHIAAAFRVPLVAIFGPTDHITTSPFSDRATIVRQDTECAPCLKRECPSDHRCMMDITVKEVVAAALNIEEKFEIRSC